MNDYIGSYYIYNTDIEPIEKLDGIRNQAKHTVYEVIRIIKGVPLFFEDHYYRLENSFKLLNQKVQIGQESLRNQINRLLETNREVNCNVKLTVFSDKNVQENLLYISKSHYPGLEEVEKGVPVGIIRWSRENPNAKILNNIYKETVSRKIEQEKVFEVLLVNDDSKITEGSKSNTFFIKDKKIYTAPGEYVLKGITRQYIIDTCKKLGFEVLESLIDLDSLNEMEGVFISGTSIKVLPISRVEGQVFQSGAHPVIVAVRDEFDRLIDEYVSKRSEAAR